LIYAGEYVFPVAVAEIFHVGTSEGFALAEAAARVRLEDEITGAGERQNEIVGVGPAGEDGCAGAAMDVDDHRIFLAGIEIFRIDQPALHVVLVSFPIDALYFAPRCG